MIRRRNERFGIGTGVLYMRMVLSYSQDLDRSKGAEALLLLGDLEMAGIGDLSVHEMQKMHLAAYTFLEYIPLLALCYGANVFPHCSLSSRPKLGLCLGEVCGGHRLWNMRKERGAVAPSVAHLGSQVTFWMPGSRGRCRLHTVNVLLLRDI